MPIVSVAQRGSHCLYNGSRSRSPLGGSDGRCSDGEEDGIGSGGAVKKYVEDARKEKADAANNDDSIKVVPTVIKVSK